VTPTVCIEIIPDHPTNILLESLQIFLLQASGDTLGEIKVESVF
jgi:hypothetical protein